MFSGALHQFLFLIKCGFREADKKQGGGGSLQLVRDEETSEWMSRINN